MSREERWKAVTEANDAVEAAVAELERENTLQTRAALDVATNKYMTCLAHVIDVLPVQMWANRMRAYRGAIDRTTRLNATMSATKVKMDAADRTFLMDAAEEQIAAADACKIAAAEVVAAVEKARADDKDEGA